MAKVAVNTDFVLNVNHKELREMVDRNYSDNIPVMVWGAPGIGKSSVIRQTAQEIAEKAGLEFLEWNAISSAQRKALATSTDNTGKFIYGDCRLSQYDPSDWAMPWVPKQDNGDADMVWAPSQLLKAYAVPGTQGMLFLDELPQAMPSVQNAAYQIILDRMYKDVSFKNIRMVAAGNRSSDGGNQYAFSPALANRFVHTELRSPYGKDWVKEWGRDNGIHPLICAFITARPNMLYEDSGKTENRRFAWASPRSWEMASKLLNGMHTYDPSSAESWVSTAFNLLYMSVGKGPAMEFQAYMLTLHDVFLEDFLKDPTKIIDASVDVQLGIVALLESHAKHVATGKDLKAKVKLVEQTMDLVDQKYRAEIRGMAFAGVLRSFRKETQNGATKSGPASIREMLSAAGETEKLKRFDRLVNDMIELLTGTRI